MQFEGVYVISVAARLLEMHPQTLRKYERFGLVAPARMGPLRRLYSEQDIKRLRLIKHLVEDLGLNLAGVELSLKVLNHLLDMRASLAEDKSEKDLKKDIEAQLDSLIEFMAPAKPR